MRPVCRTVVHAVGVRIGLALLMTIATLAGCGASPEDIAATQRGESVAPIGTPRRAEDVPLPGLRSPDQVATSEGARP